MANTFEDLFRSGKLVINGELHIGQRTGSLKLNINGSKDAIYELVEILRGIAEEHPSFMLPMELPVPPRRSTDD